MGSIMSGSCQLAISGWKLKMTMWLRPTTANQEPRESVSIQAMGQYVVIISDSISNFNEVRVGQGREMEMCQMPFEILQR